MSQLMDELEIGESLDFKGPLGDITYLGCGEFDIKGNRYKFDAGGMVAGGTGITPMYRVIRGVLDDPEDRTRLSLVFANKTEEDILLRDEFDRLASDNPERFQVWYVISEVHNYNDWHYGTGHVNADMLRGHLPPARRPDDGGKAAESRKGGGGGGGGNKGGGEDGGSDRDGENGCKDASGGGCNGKR
ncbi:unnamed protein product [Phaeothamnion confervicola]